MGAAFTLGGGVALVALLAVAAPARARAADAELRGELEELARRRVFFGHQSVGRNILDGLRELSAAGPGLRVVEAVAGDGPALAHAPIAENGDPLRKLRSFEQALAAMPPVDVALMKFCYVDFDPKTDAAGLFRAYQETLARLEERYPRTTFVRVTAPLTTVQRGAKALAKRVLGRELNGVAENAKREEFNALVRASARPDAPVFDLARVESTTPDGRREQVARGGAAVPVLVPAYSDDGGHLNADGSARAARELVRVLASAPIRGTATTRNVR